MGDTVAYLGYGPLYTVAMNNVANDHPDFHLDLGDSCFMNGVSSATLANQRYLLQRSYADLVGHSSPIFLVVGNHEEEEGWNLDDTADPADSRPIMSTNARKRYFLNPVPTPDGFYTGNTDTHPSLNGDQLHEDYYAWRWGGALFVVIDPFWYTTQKPYSGSVGGEDDDEGPGAGRWAWTLGAAQFNWLKQTLQESNAKFKFVFAHQVAGGMDSDGYGRGGAMAAGLYEWGGKNSTGTWEFDLQRPGWGSDPVHQIMRDAGVTVFFHGHDHEFAKETIDGIVYQEVPMPSDLSYGYGFNGYHESDPYTDAVKPNSGHLRVTVSSAAVTVKYIRAFLPGRGGTNGSEAYSYTISSGAAVNHPPAFNRDPFAKPDAGLYKRYNSSIVGDAVDPDGDLLKFYKISGPWLQVNTNGALSGMPTGVGAQSFVVRAKDGRGGSADATLNITVKIQ